VPPSKKIEPGAMQLTRMRLRARAAACVCVYSMIAALTAPYGGVRTLAPSPEIDEIWMMLPPCRSR
jgi:hypothetical protein